MESILHFLGLCPDNMTHPSILLILSSGFGIKYLIQNIISRIKKLKGNKKEIDSI